MTLHVKKGTDWNSVYAQARAIAPEAFEADRINNLVMGDWASVGTPSEHVNPVDQMPIQGPPKVDHQTAIDAVAAAARQHVPQSYWPVYEFARAFLAPQTRH
jgi:hypothetical protein